MPCPPTRLGKMYAVWFDQEGRQLIAADYIAGFPGPAGSDIIIFGQHGEIIARIGRSGNYEGPSCKYHDLAIDRSGNIYVGDILNNTVQKFKKRVN